jgi:hypothetical protein
MGHANAQSLRHNFDYVAEILAAEQYCIFALSETWLNRDDNLTYYSIDGYNLYATSLHERASGAAMYLPSSLSADVVLQSVCDNLRIDCLCLSVRLGVKTATFVSVYRSFRCTVSDCLADLDELFQALTLLGVPFFLMGDINIDLLADNNLTRRYKSLLKSYDLTQCIAKPTRITRTSMTLIDHFVTSDPESVLHCDSYFGNISDHNIILSAIDVRVPNAASTTSKCMHRDMRCYDPAAFFQDICWAPFHHIGFQGTVDEMTNDFVQTFMPIVDRHAPCRTTAGIAKKPRAQPLPDDPQIAAWLTAKRYHHWRYKSLGIPEPRSLRLF